MTKECLLNIVVEKEINNQKLTSVSDKNIVRSNLKEITAVAAREYKYAIAKGMLSFIA